ncbi:hypothetical protein Sjap_017969 [Stephania japonica]|uniref:2-oxoacid dehydrogenase acyltransferase catalytic domain-containing protein n=1 Tax=Stephania japonica TaxID=461633 RepID=A0AAP0I772_9MAGN
MVDLEGQDHGPSSSSVGDNDDDFIVYSKEDNATVAMECTEEVFLAKIIHGDGTKVIKVGEVKGNVQLRYIMVNATTVEDEDDIAKFKDYKPSAIWVILKKLKLQSQLNSLQEASGGERISVNDLVIKYMDDEYIRQYHSVNVAVQTEHGLFVPVVRGADKKGLSKIADGVKSFTQKAKENSLKIEDYKALSLVSNAGGTYGIKQLLRHHQSPHDLEYLSSDRVIKGAIGAEWLKAFKGYVENPESMLL